MTLTSLDVGGLGGIPMIGVRELSIGGSQLFVKRTMDVIISLVGLILLFPFFIIIAIAIQLDSPGPAFSPKSGLGKENAYLPASSSAP